MQQASCNPESTLPSPTPKERASSVYGSFSSRSRIEEEEEEDLEMARDMYNVELAEAAAKLERRKVEARQRRTMKLRESESPFQGDKSATQSTPIPPGVFKPPSHTFTAGT